MSTIAITGANLGLGYNCAVQLANEPTTKKIIIVCRSQAKCDAAIATLKAETKKGDDFFGSATCDLADLAQIKKCANSFPAFDRICLNAGGMTANVKVEAANATLGMTVNTLGHAALIDALLANGKLCKGKQVLYVGSEVSRSIWSFSGLLPNYCGNFSEKDIEPAITKNYSSYCPLPIRNQMGDYKNAKLIGHMHFLAVGRQNPEISWVHTSPGAVGGTFAERAHFPVKQLIGNVPAMFWAMGVTHAPNAKKSTEMGVKRYVDILKAPIGTYKENGLFLSPKQCGCFWGARGPMVDNAPLVSYFRDDKKALHEKTAEIVRSINGEWSKKSNVDFPNVMER